MNPTTCADCIHFRRDEINPVAGMGECMNEPSHGYWHPMAAHRCSDLKLDLPQKLAQNQAKISNR